MIVKTYLKLDIGGAALAEAIENTVEVSLTMSDAIEPVRDQAAYRAHMKQRLTEAFSKWVDWTGKIVIGCDPETGEAELFDHKSV